MSAAAGLAAMNVQAEIILIRQAAHRRQLTFRADRRYQFDERVFSLAANHEIHISRVQRRVSVKRWKIAAPCNGHFGVLLTEITANGNRRDHLRPRHDGYREQFNTVLRRNPRDSGARISIQISIDDNIVLFAFERGRDGKYGQRKPAVLWFDGAWMEQDNHLLQCLSAAKNE